MPAEEIELIDRWVENGCPQGDANKKSAVANYEQGWGISKPDQIRLNKPDAFDALAP